MDDIKEMLVKLIEGQTGIETRLDKIDTRLGKIELTQETIIVKLNTIAEVQTAHKEQSQIAHKNIDALTEEKANLLGTALKSVSKDTKDIKESVDVMKDIIGRHQIDIEILKRRPV